ncbi:D-alanyl-D-alanine carboxypeptidase [Bacillus alveayuensis]|uniref:D-alanyl-D-alanine carboxypeptidase n=2 Tax=Aeribacillus alveayuensis TaxID=279215 RepID=A0ABT9VN16_9BACI|nr:D-alanyl-D-alanine carboxypeptidase [Bacillus alveayuensis]
MREFIFGFVLFISLFAIGAETVFGSNRELSNPTISSEAAIVIEAKTGKVLFEKNSKTQLLPASITKIATAIYAIEKGNLNDMVTVSENARNVEGTRVYLEIGEQVSLKKLIQGLLINSGNDAGVAIAEHLDGSVEHFANNLNQYLRDTIGVVNTHFENPHGLYHPNHLTTAEDMAKITQYAMQNKVFREIFSTKEIRWKGQAWDTTIYTHHKLMREKPYEGVNGGKTGYIKQSGHTLVTTAQRKNLNIIVVTMKAPSQNSAYRDTEKLLDYAFNNFQNTIIQKNTQFTTEENHFINDESLYITHQIGEKVKEDIYQNGLLKVTNEHNEILGSFQLKKLKTINDKNDSSKEILLEQNKVLDINLNYLVLVAIFVSLGIMGLLFFETRKI